VSLRPYVHLDVALAGHRAGDRVPLGAPARHHLERVLRLRSGASIVVGDGIGGEAEGELDGDSLRLGTDASSVSIAGPHLCLAQALARGRKLDEVVRVGTELGMDRFVPLMSTRSIRTLEDGRASRAVERWEAVARSACEQSRRPHRPTFDLPMPVGALPQALEAPQDPARGGLLLLADPQGTPLPDAVSEVWRDAPWVTVAIGPEGGFTAHEREALVAAGALPVGLGPTVLRTEHAGAAALAVLAALLGRWSLR
jgi:16S rRNA (uracil1498-N3)-methyltransferase